MYMYSQTVKRQVASTLKSVQTMARVQSQVRTRKIRIAEVNEALREQLHQKRINKLNSKSSVSCLFQTLYFKSIYHIKLKIMLQQKR